MLASKTIIDKVYLEEYYRYITSPGRGFKIGKKFLCLTTLKTFVQK
jgi:hypothetical protein